MPDSTDYQTLEQGDPRTTKEILEGMVGRIMEGFEAIARAFSTLEEVQVDVADAMEALERRLSKLEKKKGG